MYFGVWFCRVLVDNDLFLYCLLGFVFCCVCVDFGIVEFGEICDLRFFVSCNVGMCDYWVGCIVGFNVLLDVIFEDVCEGVFCDDLDVFFLIV